MDMGAEVADLKLGSFLILASSCMKRQKNEHGGKLTLCLCLYFVPSDIHLSCRFSGNLSTTGAMPREVSKYTSPGKEPSDLAASISDGRSPSSLSFGGSLFETLGKRSSLSRRDFSIASGVP